MVEVMLVLSLVAAIGIYLFAFLATGDHCSKCINNISHTKCTNDKRKNRHEQDINDDFMR